jgi:hypothetical protein
MKSAVLAAVGAAAVGLPVALADDVVSPGPAATTATFYQSYRGLPDIALIVETRRVTLPAGRSVVRFDGVAASLVPQTASLEGLPAAPAEIDFDYALFDPQSVLTASLGQPATMIETMPKGAEVRRAGTLISQQGLLALKDGKGVESLGCGGPPARLVVPVPHSLRARPSLAATLSVDRPGSYRLRLSYLAQDIAWRAVYIATVARDGRHLDLEGRIEIDNRTASTFSRVPARFVAGEVPRLSETVARPVEAQPVTRDCWGMEQTTGGAKADIPTPVSVARAVTAAAPVPMMMKAAAGADRTVALETVGDLKLYRLDEPIHVGARNRKMFRFLARGGVTVQALDVVPVPVDRSVQGAVSHPAWQLRNDRASGLGLPLPHGQATLFGADHGYLGTAPMPVDVALGGVLRLAGEGAGSVSFDDDILPQGLEARRLVHRLTLRNGADTRTVVAVDGPAAASIPAGVAVAARPGGGTSWMVTLSPRETRTLTFDAPGAWRR